MSDKFEMTAKTFQGLEGVLADELRALGAEDVTEGRRVVTFFGDKELLYRANFCLRTALRVLKPFYKLRSLSADDLYEQLKQFPWEQLMTADTTFAIDATVYSDKFTNSRFVTYRVKDAIADYFNAHCGKRPSIRLTNPELRFDVHISDDEVTLSLDSSGEPLYKRGWRMGQTEAPINEVLAAGIILLSGWHGECDLVDPMCGSGTFLIEAALIAANINPGVYRKGFAFQQWKDYDEELFSNIYNDDSAEREVTCHIYGSDIAPNAVVISQANVKRAGMSEHITVERKDLREIEQVPAGGMLISNPPYGERLETDETFYRALGERLKHVFTGYNAWLGTWNAGSARTIVFAQKTAGTDYTVTDSGYGGFEYVATYDATSGGIRLNLQMVDEYDIDQYYFIGLNGNYLVYGDPEDDYLIATGALGSNGSTATITGVSHTSSSGSTQQATSITILDYQTEDGNGYDKGWYGLSGVEDLELPATLTKASGSSLSVSRSYESVELSSGAVSATPRAASFRQGKRTRIR